MNTKNAELIVALDVQGVQEALEIARQLQGAVPWLKVGLELFVQGGPEIISELKKLGFKIFLDLKMYDIPNTVYGGVLSACKMGVDLLTIHTQGGERMAKAAMQAVATYKQENTNIHTVPLIFGVTVLTSMSQGELPLHDGAIPPLVKHLAKGAHAWGLDGVVCSGHEVQEIQELCGKDFLCLTPGIRPKTADSDQKNIDDQRRTMTPAEAVRAGSSFLVVGRPITQAENLQKAAHTILEDMQA